MEPALDVRAQRVALLAGGKSGEREVSLVSGACVKQALEDEGLCVVMLDPANPDDLARLITEQFTVAFLCTHGRFGEDGTLQGLLELIGLPYTGSGVWSSASAINKVITKKLYEAAGISTAPFVSLRKGQPVDVPAIVEAIGEHVVVKAASEGSTLGLYIVKGADEIRAAITQAFEYDDTLLIEQFISGAEFTVAVLGNDDIRALPVIQIIPRNAFYDFDAKYSPGGSEHLCPAPLDEHLTNCLISAAEQAHRALDCRGVSRTDFIIDERGKAWALETNTLPGMTNTSLVPDAAKAAGISYGELCLKLIALALEDAQNRL